MGDDSFMEYAHASRKSSSSKLPFDLALHTLRERYNQPQRRQLAHRFQHTSFVLNLGTELPEDLLSIRAALPNSCVSGCTVHNFSLCERLPRTCDN